MYFMTGNPAACLPVRTAFAFVFPVVMDCMMEASAVEPRGPEGRSLVGSHPTCPALLVRDCRTAYAVLGITITGDPFKDATSSFAGELRRGTDLESLRCRDDQMLNVVRTSQCRNLGLSPH